MPAASNSKSRASRLSRTQMVWVVFIAATTIVVLFHTLTRGEGRGGFLMAASLDVLNEQIDSDPIFNLNASLDRTRWTSIIIHDLGLPSGDASSVDRHHRSLGYQGLGYHFLIGNGSGLGDGIVHVGYRWTDQLPGAHATGPNADYFNNRAISICLIGNGDRRSFTDRQFDTLLALIRRLQRELAIPADRVLLHRDIAPGVTSPGRFFDSAELYEQLLRTATG